MVQESVKEQPVLVPPGAEQEPAPSAPLASAGPSTTEEPTLNTSPNDGEPTTSFDEANHGPADTPLAGDVEKISALIDDIESAQSAGRNVIDGVNVVERYPGTARVRSVEISGRSLSDGQYRRFLALRRTKIAAGTAPDEVDLGAVADAVLSGSSTRAARALPGAVVVERDEFNKPTFWSVNGRRISQKVYAKLRKAYFRESTAA